MSNKIVSYVLYAMIALLAFGGGIWVSKRQAVAPEVTAAEALYAMTLPDLQNRPQKIEQWRGKVVVINFWATWCAPCRKEIPMFVKMQEKYASKGLQFVGISIDHLDKTAEFASYFNVNYPNLIGTYDAVEISRLAGNQQRALPYTVIMDRKGRISATELGGLTQEKLEALVNPLL